LVTDKQCVSTRNFSSALTGTEACPVHAKVVCYENNPTDARQKETDVSPSVLARWGTGGNQTPLVHAAFALAENTIGRQPQNGGNGTGAQKELGYTLNATGQQGVAASGFVRRLTTVECARLQGFPDHHTEIPWRGKPASECPNGPQYKAYGNSMCVNVMEWLGHKIQGEIYANSTSKMAR
jgi:DNA (cytosine-5)-methyltransferase 1